MLFQGRNRAIMKYLLQQSTSGCDKIENPLSRGQASATWPAPRSDKVKVYLYLQPGSSSSKISQCLFILWKEKQILDKNHETIRKGGNNILSVSVAVSVCLSRFLWWGHRGNRFPKVEMPRRVQDRSTDVPACGCQVQVLVLKLEDLQVFGEKSKAAF